jgi:hypothetical protein
MKIFAITALLIGIGAVPALAQNYDFTYAGSGGDVYKGTLVTSGLPQGGGYNITGGGLTILLDNFTLVTNPTPFAPAPFLGTGIYDDLLFPNGGPANLLDANGPLFLSGGSGEYVEIYQAGVSATTYGFWEGTSGNSVSINDTSGSFTITAVPDGGTTLTLLGLAIAGLACLRRKLSM